MKALVYQGEGRLTPSGGARRTRRGAACPKAALAP
jgi:hypothetical protein